MSRSKTIKMRAYVLLSLFVAIELQAATCSVSASGVAFGAYQANQTSPLDSVGTVTLTCSDVSVTTVGYSIALSQGSSSNYAARQMQSAAYTLNYNLFTDATYSQVWGDGTDISVPVNGSINIVPPANSSIDHSVYGRLFASQNATPGLYSDTIIVTVSY